MSLSGNWGNSALAETRRDTADPEIMPIRYVNAKQPAPYDMIGKLGALGNQKRVVILLELLGRQVCARRISSQ